MARSEIPHPAGFTGVSLPGLTVDVAFDGEPGSIRHSFDELMVRCSSSWAEGGELEATYSAVQLDHGALVVTFVKPAPYRPELVTVVLGTDQRSALAVCHRGRSGRTASGPSIKVMRGAIGGPFTLDRLTDFPLRVPTTTRLGLSYDGDGSVVNALFGAMGHLREWRVPAETDTTTVASASGRLLSIAQGAAILPWSARQQSGTLILDQQHQTFWGVEVPVLPSGEFSFRTVSGCIGVWLENDQNSDQNSW